MQEEIWRDIPHYETIYQVSNIGRIMALNYSKSGKSRIRKQQIDGRGYPSINLSKNGVQKRHRVHKLIAMAFLNHKPNGKMEVVVDHIDNNPLNNRLENLRLISQRENASKDRVGKSSKYVGVSKHSQHNNWVARIKIKDKYIHLGCFKTEYKAHLAYQKRLKEVKNG